MIDKIKVKRINDKKFMAKVELTNEFAYGKSIDEAIMKLKDKLNSNKDKSLIKKSKTINNKNKNYDDHKESKYINSNKIYLSDSFNLKIFINEMVIHISKLLITLSFFLIFILIAANIVLNNFESKFNNNILVERLENIANRIDNSIADFNNEISEIRPLEKLEHEILDMAREKNEIDPERQEEIIKSLIILKKRVKPFLDALKE